MTGQANNTEQIQTMLHLHETAWANFRDRRSYEWKVSFGIWTALAVFIAIIVKGEGSVPSAYQGWFWFFAVLILGLQFLFQFRVVLGHRVDTARAHFYEKLINDSLPLNSGTKVSNPVDFDCGKRNVTCYHEEAQDNITNVKGWTRMNGWVFLVIHLLITLVLMAAAFCALRYPIKPSKAASTESREITARTFTVERIVDGDTFKIVYDGEPTSVKLLGANAPERDTAEGAGATAALAKLIGGKVVRIEFPDTRKRDNLARLLCKVYVSETDVSAEMIRQGHAKPYTPKR